MQPTHIPDPDPASHPIIERLTLIENQLASFNRQPDDLSAAQLNAKLDKAIAASQDRIRDLTTLDKTVQKLIDQVDQLEVTTSKIQQPPPSP